MSVGDTAADKEISAFHEIWVHQLQPKLAALSTRGKQVVAEDSGHGIATDRPDLVIEIIHQMVRDVRR